MKLILALGLVTALVQPLSAQSIAGRWSVEYDTEPRDILAGDTVPVSENTLQGILEIEEAGDSLVAHWYSDGDTGAAPRELKGSWKDGTLWLTTLDGITVHPVVNGQEMSIDIFTEWDARLMGSGLRGTLTGTSKDGMVSTGTRAFRATRGG